MTVLAPCIALEPLIERSTTRRDQPSCRQVTRQRTSTIPVACAVLFRTSAASQVEQVPFSHSMADTGIDCHVPHIEAMKTIIRTLQRHTRLRAFVVIMIIIVTRLNQHELRAIMRWRLFDLPYMHFDIAGDIMVSSDTEPADVRIVVVAAVAALSAASESIYRRTGGRP